MFSKLRKYFLTGLVVTLPLVITVYILLVLFNFLDGFLRPFQKMILGSYIPGLSLVITFLLIVLIGVFANIAFGKKVVELFEKGILKIPVAKDIYTTIKEASTLFLMDKESEFKNVVLVEFPRKGMYSIGFTTASIVDEIQEKTKEKAINVYVPTTPIPTSGYLVLVPENEVIPLDLSVEEALKLIVSGGLSGAAQFEEKKEK